MIGVIWSLLTGNRLVRAVGAALVAVAGVLTFGALKRREGAQAARADAAVKAAKDYRETTERMQDAEASMGDDPAALREWLRQRDPNQR